MALKEIKDKLIETLKGYQPLKDYVGKNFYEGWREALIDYPAVVIRPFAKTETDNSFQRQDVSVRFIVAGLLKEMDKDIPYDELFDFENLVLKAIGQDRRLDELVQHVSVINTVYESDLFPVRNFAIEIEIRFYQNSATRA